MSLGASAQELAQGTICCDASVFLRILLGIAQLSGLIFFVVVSLTILLVDGLVEALSRVIVVVRVLCHWHLLEVLINGRSRMGLNKVCTIVLT